MTTSTYADKHGLENTGERLLPGQSDAITFWEHIYRYRFAIPFVKGKDVLDIACGEGYGSAAIAKCARSLLCIDIDDATVKHARQKYHIDARVGDATRIPLPDSCVDVVVSFETVEHISEPGTFVSECHRVLRASGRLIISTPNVSVFNPDRAKDHNPYHCSEMTRNEFEDLLSSRFGRLQMYSQHTTKASKFSSASIYANPSPWTNSKWYKRLRSKSHVSIRTNEVAGSNDPIHEILAYEPLLSRLTNPYIPRRMRNEETNAPVYFVCIAEAFK